MTLFDQAEFEIRCEWGEQGVAQLAAISDVVIIVDVLSFSTCVEVATSRGAVVYPYQWRDDSAVAYAASLQAELADFQRGRSRYSLSPESLLSITAGTKLVLPSPNGSTLSLGTGTTPTLAGCWRNYRAVAEVAQSFGRSIAVIPTGERWPDGRLRPSFEDWVGAGAIISCLNGRLSPEARAARATFEAMKHNLPQWLHECSSGKELIARGFTADVALAAELDVSACVPILIDGAYRDVKREA